MTLEDLNDFEKDKEKLDQQQEKSLSKLKSSLKEQIKELKEQQIQGVIKPKPLKYGFWLRIKMFYRKIMFNLFYKNKLKQQSYIKSLMQKRRKV